jgi:hypothetical protein
VREHHWPPSAIGGFFLDDEDEYGLEFWYNDIADMHRELKNKMKPKPKDDDDIFI